MNKLLSILAASLLALAANGTALAQQDTNRDDTQRQPSETQGGTQEEMDQGGTAQGDPAVPGAAQQGDLTEGEQEYLSALKKCEPLTGSDKEKCIERAKEKHGQM